MISNQLLSLTHFLAYNRQSTHFLPCDVFAELPVIQTAAIPITAIISYSLNATPLRNTDDAVLVVMVRVVMMILRVVKALFGAIGGPRPSADGLAFPTKTKTF